ncbi:hypothetical protein MHYP_G00096190 [Metynnis hypsauchen]
MTRTNEALTKCAKKAQILISLEFYQTLSNLLGSNECKAPATESQLHWSVSYEMAGPFIQTNKAQDKDGAEEKEQKVSGGENGASNS